VLYVDDEEKSLKMFARAFGETFRILTASSAKAGLLLLEQHPDEVAVLMTDQRMPGEKGVWLLEKARQLQPRLIRILVTAYTDMDATIAAVNSGAIYRYVSKPWDPVQLEHTLRRALEFFSVQRERDQLLKERMSVLHNMMMADRIISLGLLAAGLSHHIRNALQAVQTFLDLAPDKMLEEKSSVDGLRHPEFWKEYYRNVQAQIHRITGMLKELGSASEDPSLQFTEEVRLHEVIQGAAHRLRGAAAERDIRFDIRVPESLPPLKVDAPKFTKLFDLLLRDEVVSLPAGKTISVSAELVRHEPGSIEIRLQDDGPGMRQDALRILFDPFLVRSGSPSEYGIHLMACYFLVHHHGGKIRAESEEGKGTAFILELPVDPKQAPPLVQAPELLEKALLNEALWEKLASE
jgi:two-component system probable response regulator PhcQ